MTTASVDLFAADEPDGADDAPRSTDAPEDLCTRFFALAASDPDHPAVRWSDGSWTYARLARSVRRYAELLDDRVPSEGWVAICAGRSAESIALLLAVMCSGRAVVPVEPHHPVARIQSVLSDAAPALLISDYTAPRELGLAHEGEQANLDEFAAESVLYDGVELDPPAPDSIAYVIYTSGSTGGPKGVMVQHRQLSRFIEATGTSDPTVGSDDVVLSVASLAFDMMVCDILAPLGLGATVALPPVGARDREPTAMLDTIEQSEVTLAYATPSQLQMLVLAGLGEGGRRKIRAITGGEALSADLAATLGKRCAEVVQGYGPTETTVLVSYHPVSDPAYLPLGRPTPGSSFYPVDRGLNVLPIRARAELAIGGDLVSAGYHRRARLTAENFRPDPFADEPGARLYLSGDMVRMDDDGGALFAGRRDTQVKVRGNRVEVGEVEAALNRTDGVRHGVVVIEENDDGAIDLAAYIVGDGVDSSNVRTALERELPLAMIPRTIVVVDDIPLTVNGKPDKTALAEKARTSRATPGDDSKSPSEDDELAGKLSALWCDVLALEHVERNQSFFDLGGHSLLAMEIVARIRAEFGVDLAVWELFTVPTIDAWTRELAKALKDRPQGESEQTVRRTTSQQAAFAIAEQTLAGLGSPGHLHAYRVAGQLDVGALLSAMSSVSATEPMLRGRLQLRGADSMMVIDPEAELHFDELVADTDDDLREQLGEWVSHEFDLTAAPLWRVLLAECEDEHHLFLLFSDAIADANAALEVARRLAVAYGSDGTPDEDPVALDASHRALATMADTQRAMIGSDGNESREEWLARLRVAVGQRSQTAGFDTRAELLRLTADQNRDLREEAKAQDVPVEVAVLRRLQNLTGLRVGGIVMDGRPADETGLVGPFGWTLLVPMSGSDMVDVGADYRWAMDHAVAAETLRIAVHRTESHLVVPELVVGMRQPAETLSAGDLRWTPVLPPESRTGDGESVGRTAVVVGVELLDVPSGPTMMNVQYRSDLCDAATLQQLVYSSG